MEEEDGEERQGRVLASRRVRYCGTDLGPARLLGVSSWLRQTEEQKNGTYPWKVPHQRHLTRPSRPLGTPTHLAQRSASEGTNGPLGPSLACSAGLLLGWAAVQRGRKRDGDSGPPPRRDRTETWKKRRDKDKKRNLALNQTLTGGG
jgi:hypothetical protein